MSRNAILSCVITRISKSLVSSNGGFRPGKVTRKAQQEYKAVVFCSDYTIGTLIKSDCYLESYFLNIIFGSMIWLFRFLKTDGECTAVCRLISLI